MALLDRLKQELDRAGKVAQDAFDDGKTRLEAFRTRQLADKAAQALGYAVYRAKQSGTDLDSDSFERLRATLATHETEASRLEQQLRDISQSETQKSTEPPAPGSTSSASSTPPPPPPTDTPPPPESPAM